MTSWEIELLRIGVGVVLGLMAVGAITRLFRRRPALAGVAAPQPVTAPVPASAAPRANPTPAGGWRIAAREVVNAESRADKLVQIDLEPTEGAASWRAGASVEIGSRRYPIASLPSEGHVRLWVPAGEDPSTTISPSAVRLVADGAFRAPDGETPLLMVGMGAGLAALRPNLMEARAAGRKCWLIYGEHNPVTDGALCDELIGWQDDGSLSRLDLTFYAGADGRRVEDVFVGRTLEFQGWLGEDGAVLVSGSHDMAVAVDAALRRHMGDAWVESAIASGRYRRDIA
ncbi:hypothetical protein [Asticcacaulis solisilvae]|uniref:hypothetical protein n=1 Tax=Asticcacaulis solisilvae TaxID=1217274 RepID=UPI003FD7B3A3